MSEEPATLPYAMPDADIFERFFHLFRGMVIAWGLIVPARHAAYWSREFFWRPFKFQNNLEFNCAVGETLLLLSIATVVLRSKSVDSPGWRTVRLLATAELFVRAVAVLYPNVVFNPPRTIDAYLSTTWRVLTMIETFIIPVTILCAVRLTRWARA